MFFDGVAGCQDRFCLLIAVVAPSQLKNPEDGSTQEQGQISLSLAPRCESGLEQSKIEILQESKKAENMRFLATALLGMVLVSGCTWVKPTPGGDQVRVVASPADVAGCREIGKTTVSLLDRVGAFKRDQKKVEDELAILGRNSAAEMGGDTILPVSEVFQGERRFMVYRCRGN